MSDSVTPRTLAHQAPLSMRFSRQEYWSGLPFFTPGDLPNLGIEPGSLASQADSSSLVPPRKPKNSEAKIIILILQFSEMRHKEPNEVSQSHATNR